MNISHWVGIIRWSFWARNTMSWCIGPSVFWPMSVETAIQFQCYSCISNLRSSAKRPDLKAWHGFPHVKVSWVMEVPLNRPFFFGSFHEINQPAIGDPRDPPMYQKPPRFPPDPSWILGSQPPASNSGSLEPIETTKKKHDQPSLSAFLWIKSPMVGQTLIFKTEFIDWLQKLAFSSWNPIFKGLMIKNQPFLLTAFNKWHHWWLIKSYHGSAPVPRYVAAALGAFVQML